MREQQLLYITISIVRNNTTLHGPDGPNIMILTGSFPTTSYFNCLAVYALILICSTFGASIIF